MQRARQTEPHESLHHAVLLTSFFPPESPLSRLPGVSFVPILLPLVGKCNAFTVLPTMYVLKPDPKAEPGEVSEDGLSHTAGSRLLATGVPREVRALLSCLLSARHRRLTQR